MRLKSAFVCLMILGAAAAIQAAAAPNDPCDLPPGLQAELSKRYPDTRVVRLADLSQKNRRLFQKDHGKKCPGLARVNFYGDGKPTWAVVLISGENPKRKAELVMARQIGDSWEMRSLDKTDGTPVVWREGPGKYDDLDGKKVIQATSSVVVFAGYGSWSVLYAWTGKDARRFNFLTSSLTGGTADKSCDNWIGERSVIRHPSSIRRWAIYPTHRMVEARQRTSSILPTQPTPTRFYALRQAAVQALRRTKENIHPQSLPDHMFTCSLDPAS